MSKDQALRLALEALEPFITPNWAGFGWEQANKAHAACKQALEQPEPVALNKNMTLGCPSTLHDYTSPPKREWQGLTGAEIEEAFQQSAGADEDTHIRFARAIEAKLKQKNTWQDGDCKHCVNGCPACDARRQSNVLL